MSQYKVMLIQNSIQKFLYKIYYVLNLKDQNIINEEYHFLIKINQYQKYDNFKIN